VVLCQWQVVLPPPVIPVLFRFVPARLSRGLLGTSRFPLVRLNLEALVKYACPAGVRPLQLAQVARCLPVAETVPLAATLSFLAVQDLLVPVVMLKYLPATRRRLVRKYRYVQAVDPVVAQHAFPQAPDLLGWAVMSLWQLVLEHQEGMCRSWLELALALLVTCAFRLWTPHAPPGVLAWRQALRVQDQVGVLPSHRGHQLLATAAIST
jgi:hypothetical protein